MSATEIVDSGLIDIAITHFVMRIFVPLGSILSCI